MRVGHKFFFWGGEGGGVCTCQVVIRRGGIEWYDSTAKGRLESMAVVQGEGRRVSWASKMVQDCSRYADDSQGMFGTARFCCNGRR